MFESRGANNKALKAVSQRVKLAGMRPGHVKGFAVALLLASLAGVARSNDSSFFGGYFQNDQCSTPYALAADSHNLQTLAAAIKAAGLVNILDSTTSAITVFAPTDDAFAALASALSLTSEELLSKSDLLSVILEYHVYSKDAYKVSDFKKHSSLVTAQGETLTVKTVGDIVTVVPDAGSTATVLVSDMNMCKAYVQVIDTVLIPEAAAKSLGMVSVDVPGAGETDTQAAQSLVSKKTGAATSAAAVPVETILVPANPVATVPPVAVSGMRVVLSPSPELVPVATVLVPAPTPKATIVEGHKLMDSLVTKFPLNTFSTPTPTPEGTSAPSVPTLKELLLHETPSATEAVFTPTTEDLKELLLKATPAASPVETILVPAATTVPAVAVSGARAVPMVTPAVVPVPVVEASPPTQPKLVDLLTKKTLNTFTPVATEEAAPKPSVPTLNELLLKETPAATEAVASPVKTPLLDLLNKETPAATPLEAILVPTTPVATVPEGTAPAVPVSGARLVASAVPSAVLATTPIMNAVAPAIERVGTTVSAARSQREAAVAPARAAVAQAATAVVDDRRAMFSPTTAGAPVVTAQDGPDVSSGYMGMAMAPQMMAMAPDMMGMAPESAPMAGMAPGVQALSGPDPMMMGTPEMAPEAAPMAATAPEAAPLAAMAPEVAALAGPDTMAAPAMAPGTADFGALDALKTSSSSGSSGSSSSSSCTSVLQAAMMVPELSTFVTTAQAANLTTYLRDPTLVATVFVPTNEAFTTALSQFGVTPTEALAQPSLLKGLLQYHVVPGMAMTTSTLTNGQTLTTALAGQTLKVNKTGARVTIQPATGSAANILNADMPVCMAEMNIVDTLLFPSTSALPPSAAALVAGRTMAGG